MSSRIAPDLAKSNSAVSSAGLFGPYSSAPDITKRDQDNRIICKIAKDLIKLSNMSSESIYFKNSDENEEEDFSGKGGNANSKEVSRIEEAILR